MRIRYVKHKDIDKAKWDDCIKNAVNSLVYGLSWYLDVVCENWDALVSDDYEAVMPLPWKKKLGVKFVYQPFFAQQLGVFYRRIADDQTYEFLEAIPKSFLKYHTSLNFLNEVKDLSLNIRDNYILDLNKPYEEIFKGFSENTRRNVKKAKKENFTLSENISIDKFIQLNKQHAKAKLDAMAYQRIAKLIDTAKKKEVGKLLAVLNNKDEVLGAVFLVNYKNRIIYLFSVSTQEGIKRRAMFWLVNQIIEQSINKGKILDFEGSMIEGVARFFRGFGSVNEQYYWLSKSKIPFFK